MKPLSELAGLPVYLSQPVVCKHTARRRGQAGRVRSRRTWIDRVSPSPLEPTQVVIMRGKCIVAGATAYAALKENAAAKERCDPTQYTSMMIAEPWRYV